jgi:hypothetical protein
LKEESMLKLINKKLGDEMQYHQFKPGDLLEVVNPHPPNLMAGKFVVRSHQANDGTPYKNTPEEYVYLENVKGGWYPSRFRLVFPEPEKLEPEPKSVRFRMLRIKTDL